MRIIPPTDDGDFPYDAALRLLQQSPDIRQRPTDITAIVTHGIAIGWPQDLVDLHMRWLQEGGVFDFDDAEQEGISCTLWRDNIFFRFFSDSHHTRCIPMIEAMASTLGCRILR